MAGDAKDLGTTEMSVVDDERGRLAVAEVLHDLGEEQSAQLIDRPRAAREEPMQSLVVNPALDPGIDAAWFGESKREDFVQAMSVSETSVGPPGGSGSLSEQVREQENSGSEHGSETISADEA